MTTTEPEFVLAEVAEEQASTTGGPTWLGLVGRAVLGSVLGVFSSAGLSLIGLEGSYAGARDDATAARALSAYGPFLEMVGRELGWIALAEAGALAPVVLGLLLLLRAHPRSASWLGGRVLLPTVLGWSAVFALFAGVAHRHPGLFLSILASSHVLTFSASCGHLIAGMVFGGAALGYLTSAVAGRPERRAQIGCVLALLGIAGLCFTGSQWRGRERVFRNSTINALTPGNASDALHDVLFLAVDSLRPDMIDAEHTPHLQRLIAESIYFPNTLVTQPRTGPSWTATLTSLAPLSNGIETMFPDAKHSQVENFSLPAHLSSLGYRTAVFSEYAGEFFSRANFGFQVRAVPSVELKDITGQMLMMRLPNVLAAASVLYTQGSFGRALLGRRVDNLMRGMANFASPQVLEDDMLALVHRDAPGPDSPRIPFFWLAFYSQPHFPYTSSSDFYPKYQVPGASPELRFGRDAVGEAPIERAEDRAQVLGLYRAALAETDAAIGKLLERLEAEDRLDNTIIVLMADHGEGLYECPTCVGHGDNLRSMLTLEVPLAFHLPREQFPQVEPQRVEGYVSQLDVYPTILALLGQEPLAPQEGVPLLDAKGRHKGLPQRDFFTETGEWLWPTPAVPRDRIAYPVITEMAKLERGRIAIDAKYLPEIRAAKQRAVIRPPYKLTYEPGASEVRYHLYQFEKDPFETEDLAASQPEIVSALKLSLRHSMLRHPDILELADYFLTRAEPPPPESF
jgi:hypothetical protein